MFGFFSELKKECLTPASLWAWRFLQASPWKAKGKNANMSAWLPTTTTNFHFFLLTTYHVSQNHMYAQDPKIFLHEGFPAQPSGLLEIGHPSQSFRSPWTPWECPSKPSDTCSLPVWMRRSLLWDHWHSGRPPKNSLNQMVGRWAPRPSLRGLTWSTIFKNHNPKKKYFGSPVYKLSSSLIENDYRDRLCFSSHLAIFWSL